MNESINSAKALQFAAASTNEAVKEAEGTTLSSSNGETTSISVASSAPDTTANAAGSSGQPIELDALSDAADLGGQLIELDALPDTEDGRDARDTEGLGDGPETDHQEMLVDDAEGSNAEDLPQLTPREAYEKMRQANIAKN